MRKARTTLWLSSIVLLIVAVLTSCIAIAHNKAPSGKQVKVPDDIVQDLLAQTALSSNGDGLSDLKWEMYSEEESRRLVGATFKAKDSKNQDNRWYYIMAYGPQTKDQLPKKVHGALARIDDPDFNVSGFSVCSPNSPDGKSATPTLVTAGYAIDEKVTKVVLETSAGRTLEATMRERFWLLSSPAMSAAERITKAIGYAKDGTRLHLHYVFQGQHSTPTLSLEAKVEAGFQDSDPLIREAWSLVRKSIEDSEKESKRIFAKEASKFADAEMTKLNLIDAFDQPGNKQVTEVYVLKYRMLPEDQSKISLSGGMTIRDGWLLSLTKAGDPYLVAKRIGNTITCVGTFHAGSYNRNTAQEFLLRVERK